MLQKNRYLRLLLAFVILLLGGIFLAPTKAEAVGFDTSERGTYYVKNIEELNEVFGGNHVIDGQTLILQSDVYVEYNIWIKHFAGSNCIIDLNGKTIPVRTGRIRT